MRTFNYKKILFLSIAFIILSSNAYSYSYSVSTTTDSEGFYAYYGLGALSRLNYIFIQFYIYHFMSMIAIVIGLLKFISTGKAGPLCWTVIWIYFCLFMFARAGSDIVTVEATDFMVSAGINKDYIPESILKHASEKNGFTSSIIEPPEYFMIINDGLTSFCDLLIDNFDATYRLYPLAQLYRMFNMSTDDLIEYPELKAYFDDFNKSCVSPVLVMIQDSVAQNNTNYKDILKKTNDGQDISPFSLKEYYDGTIFEKQPFNCKQRLSSMVGDVKAMIKTSDGYDIALLTKMRAYTNAMALVTPVTEDFFIENTIKGFYSYKQNDTNMKMNPRISTDSSKLATGPKKEDATALDDLDFFVTTFIIDGVTALTKLFSGAVLLPTTMYIIDILPHAQFIALAFAYSIFPFFVAWSLLPGSETIIIEYFKNIFWLKSWSIVVVFGQKVLDVYETMGAGGSENMSGSFSIPLAIMMTMCTAPAMSYILIKLASGGGGMALGTSLKSAASSGAGSVLSSVGANLGGGGGGGDKDKDKGGGAGGGAGGGTPSPSGGGTPSPSGGGTPAPSSWQNAEVISPLGLGSGSSGGWNGTTIDMQPKGYLS